METILEVVRGCNNFSEEDDGHSEQKLLRWRFFLPNDQRCHGWITHSAVRRLPWTCDFQRNFLRKTVTLAPISSEPLEKSCDEAIEKLLDRAREQGHFPILHEKRDEKYAILGANFSIGIERSASSLFGIVGQGVHMTIYTHTETGEMKIWVPQRNLNKRAHPGLLDNAVAGGVALGEQPFECLCREANEEAGLSEEFMKGTKPAGTISWFNVNDSRSDGQRGLMNPGLSCL